jgi:tRNA modification GTPase
MQDFKDTIAAIATAPGEAGIGIVRISGRGALFIADKVFSPKRAVKPSRLGPYSVCYGRVIDKEGVVDEALLTVMRRPRSFTREDVVEISCHGSIVALRKVLDLVIKAGARLASPGEFTRRAFLAGRIDLTQAEAVLDVIRAKTDSALKLGSQQLEGALSAGINTVRNRLFGALVPLEANIDFPEEDIATCDMKKIKSRLERAGADLKRILDTSRCGRVLREGVHTVICGKPNVGKSSLLNALLRQERSIVTHIPGTTRDTIEEIIDIKGIPVRIVDTAGIIRPRDLVEKKAVQHSKKHIDTADIAIIMFDGSKKLDSQDELIISRLCGKTAIAVINKIDLKQNIEREKIEKRFKRTIDISAKNCKNINLLEEQIRDIVYNGAVSVPEYAVVSNMRHIGLLRQAQGFVKDAQAGLIKNRQPELISQDIKDAMAALDEILGRRFNDKLLDKIFSEFCIGK